MKWKWPFELEAMVVCPDDNWADMGPEAAGAAPVGSTRVEQAVMRLLKEGAFLPEATPAQQEEIRVLGEMALEDFATSHNLTVEEIRAQYLAEKALNHHKTTS